MGVITFGTFVS